MSRLYVDLRHAAIVPDGELRSSNMEDGYLTRIVGSLGGSIVFETDGPSTGAETECTLSVSSGSDSKADSIEMVDVTHPQSRGTSSADC